MRKGIENWLREGKQNKEQVVKKRRGGGRKARGRDDIGNGREEMGSGNMGEWKKKFKTGIGKRGNCIKIKG